MIAQRLLLSLLFLAAARGAFAAPDAPPQCVIIAGLGGAPDYDAAFPAWATRLRDTLAKQGGMQCHLLTANEKGPAQSTLDSIRAAFTAAAAHASAETDFFIFLIGHGSFMKGEAKLNLPGPDLSAADLKAMIDAVPCRRAVIVNGSSCSAPFINALSAPARIIVAATKSSEENNATQFMGQFIDALEKGGADQNRDDRVSVLEAARQAAALTDAWYLDKGWMTTEHALLDDNGDGRGTRPVDIQSPTPASTADAPPDGLAADECYLIQRAAPPDAPAGVEAQYNAILAEVEALKRRKAGMPADTFYAELEKLMVKAARLNRQLRPPT